MKIKTKADRRERIHLRQRKTGKPLVIPIHPALQAVLDATQVVGSRPCCSLCS